MDTSVSHMSLMICIISQEILEKPERLRDLDLEAFSIELERQGYGQKLTTLYDIRAELNCRYKDPRAAYKPIEMVERFNMLTKETPATLYIGKVAPPRLSFGREFFQDTDLYYRPSVTLVGKLVLCRVSNIARKKPQGQQLDEANPEKSEETGLWVCPFCRKDDFVEISEVVTTASILMCGSYKKYTVSVSLQNRSQQF